MNEKLLQLKRWFEARSFRERVFVLLLCLASIYFLCYYTLLHALEKKEAVVLAEIKEVQNQANAWQNQIEVLDKLSQTPLYHKWLKQRSSLTSLKGQYKFLQSVSPKKQWQDVIRTILKTEQKIKLVQIKNFPESIYNPTNIPVTNKIYQQRLLLVLYGDYFDTVNYLKQLEQLLPNIRWDSLDYLVTQYPTAKVETEFSILYEKND